jgi:multidrug resistance efflux pump
MTWSNRFRLYGGLIVVIALVAALTLVFNQRRSQALSLTAHVVADQVTVGAQFGGVVVDQKVAAGDSVAKGDSLYTVVVPRSVGNAGEAVNAVAAVRNAAYVVDPKKSTVTYRALTTGVLTDVQSSEGGFVQSGAALATITAVGSQYAVAEFRLSPRDYGRVATGAHVDLLLPDNRTVAGEVRAVSVTTDGGTALTKVTISSDALRDPANARLTAPGTPLSATLSLRDDGPLAGPTDAMVDFLRKIGVR